MSAPVPATRRSGSGSRRFNPLRVLQPKRRLQQILSETRPPAVTAATAGRGGAAEGGGVPERGPSAPVPIPVPTAPAFDYCRFIELDYVPMESGLMTSMRPTKSLQTPNTKSHLVPSSRSPTKGFSERHSGERHASAPSTPRSRRTAPPGSRDHHGNPSLCSSSSGSCKGSDCSPTKGRQKLKSCVENHGIRPPPPEQYLTPLQQKEVCIRHLRSKLRETIDTLQTRDCEIDELRERLFRMQEDWVEEECHRVEAQLALKEARTEIQTLKQAVEGVRARLSDDADFQDINSQNHRLESLLLNMEVAQGLVKDAEERAGFRTRVGGSAPASVSGESPRTTPGGRGGSCSSSPARSITRSSTYTKLTEQNHKSGHEFGSMSAEGTQDSGFVCESGESNVPSRADLLLEAAYLSEETASLLSAYTRTFATLPNTLPNMQTFNTLPNTQTFNTLPNTQSFNTLPNTQTFNTLPNTGLNAVPCSAPNALPHMLPQAYSQTLPHSFPRNHTGHAPPALLPHSSTCEGLCEQLYSREHPCTAAEHLAPFRCGLSSMTCMSHPCLSHHHLYLHALREAGMQTESCPIPGGTTSDLDTIAEARTFRSQACSPTSTWASDEGEELDSTSLTTATVMSAATEPVPGTSLTYAAHALPRSATVAEGPLCSHEDREELEKPEKPESENHMNNQNQEKQENDQNQENQAKQEKEKEERETRDKEATDSETKSDKSEESKSRTIKSEATHEQVQLSEMLPLTVQGEDKLMEDKLAPHGEDKVASQGEDKQMEDKLVSQGEDKQMEDKLTSCVEDKLESRGEDMDITTCTELEAEDLSCPALTPDETQTSQPKRGLSPEQVPSAGTEADAEDTGPVQRSYWSRHFLVDLLAVAIPVVPTVAWLCRGPVRDGQPMYHIGSLLRGCCTVALHSLRRSGGLRHYPAGGGAHI